MQKLCGLIAVFSLCLIGHSASAHHSFAAEFDYDASGAIDGEVIEVLYVNPHARYFIAVVNSDGNEEVWDTQTSSISSLSRYGWTEDIIQIGDRVRIQGNMGRDNTRKIWIREVTLEDGRVIRPVAGGVNADEATRDGTDR